MFVYTYIYVCLCVCETGQIFFFSLAQPLPAHKRHILEKEKKMYFPPAFQQPELSGGMNGLGKISHRNKFTRDS